MKKKINFIADFFYDQLKGGAESDDDFLITKLKEKGYQITKINSDKLTIAYIQDHADDFYIVGNFVKADPIVLNALKKINYIIFEHDHKYLRTRDPSPFINFKAPQNEIANKDFYQKAKAVFVFSKAHSDIIKKNLDIDNIINIGTAFWTEEQFKFLKEQANVVKTKQNAILKSANKIKGTSQAAEFCKRKKLDYEFAADPNWYDFIEKLAAFKNLIFFPQVFETYSKLVMEAKMVGLSVMTTPKKIGAFSESNAKLSGLELQEDIQKRIRMALNRFEEVIESETNKITGNDLTVILNAYRRPHLLVEQIEAIRNQTVAGDADIWIWVNHHEDNQDFDFEQFGLKVFHNNYNWKYYGRYAAALLAETKYIAFFDDDTIPGSKWFENCGATLERVGRSVLGGAGIRLHGRDSYFRHDRTGWAVPSETEQECDLIGHAWFLEKEILRTVFAEEPYSYETGEDIFLSAMAQKYGGFKTFTPPHPADNKEMWSSLKGNEYGIDAVASSNPANHHEFYRLRDEIVRYLCERGWKLCCEGEK